MDDTGSTALEVKTTPGLATVALATPELPPAPSASAGSPSTPSTPSESAAGERKPELGESALRTAIQQSKGKGRGKKAEKPPVPRILVGDMLAAVLLEARKSGLFGSDETIEIYAYKQDTDEEFVMRVQPDGQVLISKHRLT